MTTTKKQARCARAAAALSPKDRDRLVNDINDNSVIGPKQVVNWLRDAVRVTGMVAAGDTDMIPVFWIRLYGVLAEVAAWLGKQRKCATSYKVKVPTLAPLEQAIAALAKAFTDDELIYLQYYRHVECHVLQDSYRLRLTSKGLRDSVFHRLLETAKDVDATNEAIKRVLMKRGAEHQIARDFAERAASLLANIEEQSIPHLVLV